MTLDTRDRALVSAIRAAVREELERAEAHRKGERPAGQRRVRSPELAARIAAEIAGPVDEVTRARVDRAIERRRRRTG